MHSVMVISSMGHWTRWAEKSCKRRKSWQPFPSNGLRQIERRENSTNVLFHYGDRKLSSYEIKSNEIFETSSIIQNEPKFFQLSSVLNFLIWYEFEENASDRCWWACEPDNEKGAVQSEAMNLSIIHPVSKLFFPVDAHMSKMTCCRTWYRDAFYDR